MMMNQSPAETALSRAMIRWSLTKATPVAESPRSWIFRVEQNGRDFAVLKIMKPLAAEEEGRGSRLLQWYGGEGAATVFDIEGNAVFMEWIDGGTLGEPARTGRDEEATIALATLVGRLHAPRPDAPTDLLPLRERFRTLFDTDVRLWPHTARDLYARAAGVALTLFDKPAAMLPLHGDCTTTISSPPIAAGWPSIPRVCWVIRLMKSPTPSAIPMARSMSLPIRAASRPWPISSRPASASIASA